MTEVNYNDECRLVNYNLSARLLNCLYSAGINTVGELLSYIKDNGMRSLCSCRTFGKKSLSELEDFVEEVRNYRDATNIPSDSSLLAFRRLQEVSKRVQTISLSDFTTEELLNELYRRTIIADIKNK